MMWRTDEKSSLLCSGDRTAGLGIQLKSSIADEVADQNYPLLRLFLPKTISSVLIRDMMQVDMHDTAE